MYRMGEGKVVEWMVIGWGRIRDAQFKVDVMIINNSRGLEIKKR